MASKSDLAGTMGGMVSLGSSRETMATRSTPRLVALRASECMGESVTLAKVVAEVMAMGSLASAGESRTWKRR